MENCYSFSLEILLEVMRSVGDIPVEADLKGDNEAETCTHISFCIILKTTILIADKIFDHYVNDCIFLDHYVNDWHQSEVLQ